jgi:F-type H+-transporting ATPase subunit epsilon
MERLHLNIVSPEKQLFDGDVSSVQLPGTLGAFTILPEHAPIVSSLTKGVITYVTDSENTLAIDGGFIEMSNGVVSVCVS